MNKKFKKIPQFKNEGEERQFWSTHDSTEYIDWSKAKNTVFPNLKPSTKKISLRLPEYLLNKIKTSAHKQNVPYQSFKKLLLDQSFSK